MTETEIENLSRELWEQDRKLQFTELYQVYFAALRRGYYIGFSRGEAEHFRDEVVGVAV